MDVQFQVVGSHTSSVTFHIGFPVVRTDGRAGERAGRWTNVDYQNFLDGLVTNQSRVLSALQSRRKTKQMNPKKFPGELSSENPLVFRKLPATKTKAKN